jgi:hypothetical protein
MDVRLTQRYRFWMWLLLPLTLGVGTLAMFANAMRWPRQLDARGIVLRNGRLMRWSDITRLGVVEHHFEREVIELDVYFTNGVARVPVRHLEDGEQVAAAVRANFHRSRSNAA